MDVFEQVRSLVRQTVEQYVKKQEEIGRKIPIAILLNYQSSEQNGILEAVSILDKAYHVTIVLGNSWLSKSAELEGMNWINLEETRSDELMELVKRSTILVFPASSFQLLTKLALTIDDDPAIKLAIQFQLAGKPLVIANDDVELNVYQQISAPYSVQERLQTYIRQLQADQVKWVPLKQLPETVDRVYDSYNNKQTFILARHIEAAHREGLQEIIVPENSQLTPGGKDMAKQLKVHIKKRES